MKVSEKTTNVSFGEGESYVTASLHVIELGEKTYYGLGFGIDENVADTGATKADSLAKLAVTMENKDALANLVQALQWMVDELEDATDLHEDWCY